MQNEKEKKFDKKLMSMFGICFEVVKGKKLTGGGGGVIGMEILNEKREKGRLGG